jgi:hypothetical protein
MTSATSSIIVDKTNDSSLAEYVDSSNKDEKNVHGEKISSVESGNVKPSQHFSQTATTTTAGKGIGQEM